MDEEQDRKREVNHELATGWFGRLWPYRRYTFDTAIAAEDAIEELKRSIRPRLASGFPTLAGLRWSSTTGFIGTATGTRFHLWLAQRQRILVADVDVEASPYGARVHVRIRPSWFFGLWWMVMIFLLVAASFPMLLKIPLAGIFFACFLPLLMAAFIGSELAVEARSIDTLLKTLIGPDVAVSPGQAPYR